MKFVGRRESKKRHLCKVSSLARYRIEHHSLSMLEVVLADPLNWIAWGRRGLVDSFRWRRSQLFAEDAVFLGLEHLYHRRLRSNLCKISLCMHVL